VIGIIIRDAPGVFEEFAAVIYMDSKLYESSLYTYFETLDSAIITYKM